MRLLIYGAGVIGCWYAVLFSKPDTIQQSMQEARDWNFFEKKACDMK